MLYLSCRGILFFNQCIAFFVACFCNVSVPCRGILFFNYAWFTRLSSSKSFRPLSGNLIFQFFLVRKAIHFPPTHFRPLSGNLIFQSWKCTCQKRPGLFPSPIGESYFSIVREYEKRNDRIVSVPYRGILFFNMGNK